MSKPLFKFGIVTDVQYANLPQDYENNRPAPLGIRKLTEAIDEFDRHNLEFIINLGDLIDRDQASFGPILEVAYKAKAPFWHTLGNHDFCGPDYDYGHKESALMALGLSDETRYRSNVVGSYRFIILDSCEVGVIESKQDTPEYEQGRALIESVRSMGRINFKDWNGGLSNKQLSWLKLQIKEAGASNQKVIVFAHHGIYPEHRENLLLDQELLSFLKAQQNVVAYINGHNHDGNYGKIEGLHCLTIEGMMDFEDKTAYAVAELYDDRIKVKGFGRVPDRTLKFK